MSTAPLIAVRDLRQWFPIRQGWLGGARRHVHAVDGVSFEIARGEILGLVGESGSGKTTVGRAILRIYRPTAGQVVFRGNDIARLPRRRLHPYRRRLQLVFQDPFSSLDPRMTVAQILAEPLVIHGLLPEREARESRVRELLHMVGLGPEHLARYPHELSGGQCQRVGIARALAPAPEFVVADEPVSALDVSIQAQIVTLLQELRTSLGLTLLFIAHDLAVVEYISDRVAVMYLGKIMEVGPSRELTRRPRHPYTEALLSAVPTPDPRAKRKRIVLQGDVPSPIDPPPGCVFNTRCPYAIADCRKAVPALREVAPGHFKACIRDDVL